MPTNTPQAPAHTTPPVRTASEVLEIARIGLSRICALLMPFTDCESEALWVKPDYRLSAFGIRLAEETTVVGVGEVRLDLWKMHGSRLGLEYGPGLDEAWDYLDRAWTMAFMVEGTLEMMVRYNDTDPVEEAPSYLSAMEDMVRHQLRGPECMPTEVPAHA